MEIQCIKNERSSKGQRHVTYNCEVYQHGSLLVIFPVAASSEREAITRTLGAISRLYSAFIDDEEY